MKLVSNAGTDPVLDLVRPWLKADKGLDMVSPTLSLFAFAEVLGDAACHEPRIAVTEAEALALGMAAWRKEQAPAGDTTAVFRDSAFENAVAKSNLAAILQQYGIGQVRSL